ncbi:ceramidase [Aspergillus venezuelensis]
MSGIDPVEPFWGSPTSKANFCETSYAISRYIAEFVNGLTSIIYVIYGIYGLLRLTPRRSRVLPYWSFIAVGICSFVLHVYLKHQTQMMDDLSMHLTTMPVLHRVLTANSDRQYSVIMGIVLGAILCLLVTIHVLTDD